MFRALYIHFHDGLGDVLVSKKRQEVIHENATGIGAVLVLRAFLLPLPHTGTSLVIRVQFKVHSLSFVGDSVRHETDAVLKFVNFYRFVEMLDIVVQRLGGDDLASHGGRRQRVLPQIGANVNDAQSRVQLQR